MDISRSYQPSFFDESERLTALSKLRDPLEALATLIDFEIFRQPLEQALEERPAKGPGGRPAMDAVMMFKMLILQRLYNLSDEQVEFQVTDRLSFTRFLGLRLGDKVPDFTTLWRFRERLGRQGLERRAFDLFHEQLDAAGVLAKTGSIIDATIVEVPIQRNTRAENDLVKKGQTPAGWKDQPHKLRQKDVQARWTRQGPQTFYGYKDHIKTDAGTTLITDYRVTPANTHDSVPAPEMISASDAGRPLYADAAYGSEAMDRKLQRLGVENRIQIKGRRGAPLSDQQRQHNRQKARIRVMVEHVFAFMENSMNCLYLRCIGLSRATTQIGLANLTYNLCRYVQLVRLGRVQPVW